MLQKRRSFNVNEAISAMLLINKLQGFITFQDFKRGGSLVITQQAQKDCFMRKILLEFFGKKWIFGIDYLKFNLNSKWTFSVFTKFIYSSPSSLSSLWIFASTWLQITKL